MTLTEARAIVARMSPTDERDPTAEQQQAKQVIFKLAVAPMFPSEIPPYAEPDFKEGWR